MTKKTKIKITAIVAVAVIAVIAIVNLASGKKTKANSTSFTKHRKWNLPQSAPPLQQPAQ